MATALAAFLSGIFASLLFHWLFILLFTLIAAVLSVAAKKHAVLALWIAGLLLGFVSIRPDPGADIPDGAFVTRTFRVTGFPVLREDGKYEIKCGSIKIISPDAFRFYRTQTVRAAGTASVMETNGNRYCRVYAKETEIVDRGFMPFSFVSAVRKWVNDRILTACNADVRALLFAMITGNANFLGYSVKESFRMTGITHLLAISGMNVAVIGMAIYFLLGRIAGKKTALLVSAAAVALYVVAAGFSASILRAGIMFILYQFLKYTGRNPDPLDVVAVSVFPVLAFDAAMLFDIGFWLSYGAVLGILFFSSAFRELFKKTGKHISEALAVTLSANLTTIPVLALCFRGISLVSPLTNLIVIPVFNLITLALFAEFLFLLTGIPVLPGLTESAISILWSFCTGVSGILSFLPGSFLSLTREGAVLLTVIYGVSSAGTLMLPSFLFRARLKFLNALRVKPFPEEEG